MVPGMIAGVSWFGAGRCGLGAHLVVAVVVGCRPICVCLRRIGVGRRADPAVLSVPDAGRLPLAAVVLGLAWIGLPDARVPSWLGAVIGAVSLYAAPLGRWWLPAASYLCARPRADADPDRRRGLRS